jgi:CRP/FNR family cyclic AMP-dependent transcriptional regulator
MTDEISWMRNCMINEHSVFRFLCEENFAELAGYFQYKTVKSGEVLWVEGDPCDYVAIISSGRVEIKKKTEFEGKYVV